MIDTHSHIYDEAFDADRLQAIERAANVGVNYQLLPNVDSSTTGRLLDVVQQCSTCFPLMGLHPTSVKADFEHELAHVEQQLAERKFFGVGEIGMDLYWDRTFASQQVEVFRHQLRLAKRMGLPVSIHVRNAFDEVFAVVDSEICSDLSGVFHCFTGTLEQYRHIHSYGTFMVGIGGVVTYKNAGLATVIPHIDPNKLLLETDSPYLAPVPMRGKRNEPAFLSHIAPLVAKLMQISVDELDAITTANAIKLFKLKIFKQ